jgi:type I restriction enzyme R subunit
MASLAAKYALQPAALNAFVDEIMGRMIFDGEKLSDLLAPLNLAWRERAKKELELMGELIPLLKKLAGGRVIAGLNAYE